MVAFEASSRVPLVIAGPGIAKGIEILSLHSLVDLLPTFLDLAGASVPVRIHIHSRLLDLMNEKPRASLATAADQKPAWTSLCWADTGA